MGAGHRLWTLLGALAAAAFAAAGAQAAVYSVNVQDGLNLQQVASGATGDTVFRISPSSGVVTVVSGSGRRLSNGSARAMVTIGCKPSRANETKCNSDNVVVRIGTVGSLFGRARALTNFTVTLGTATIVTPPSGGNPLAMTLAPIPNNQARTFFVGADFPVAGDDSNLATGAGEGSFYVYVLDEAGQPQASDTDKAKVVAFRSLTISKTADLSFGRIQIPASGTSTVALNAVTGVRTVTGSAFAYPTPTPTRAAFNVTGEGGQQVSLSIPAALNFTGPSTIPVAITHTAAATPTLSGGLGQAGTYSFTVGGSFPITSSTPTGAYAGTLTVSLDYN